MPSTTLPAIVVTNVARRITEQLLAPRRQDLRHRAPRSKYVHQLRRDISSAKSTPIEKLFSVSVSDLEDHVVLARVLEPYHTMIAELTAMHQQISGAPVREDVPLLPLAQSVTREAAAFTMAEQAVLALAAQPALDDRDAAIAAIDRTLAAEAQLEEREHRVVRTLRAMKVRLTMVAPARSATRVAVR